MPNKLYNILVPVDFTGKNKWAIVKAIELSNSFNCNIHLVHVLHRNILPLVPLDVSMVTPYESFSDRMNSCEKLRALAAEYRPQLCGNGTIEISVLEGPLSKRLSEYIQLYHIDLAVIGITRFNFLHRILSSVSISRLARKTNIPVLAVQAGGLICHFKKIILPVHNQIPTERIKLATMMARTFKSTVYLVSLRNADKTTEKIMNQALEFVQSISTVPVQSIILEGKNLAKTTLEFAKKINADLIMINPLKEFKLPGLWNKVTNKLLPHSSTIPVLTVEKSSEQ
jgi:nucleotide-binding universal stress UspA family protein